MDERIVSLAYDILAIILPVLALATVELLRRKLGVEKLRKVQKELETKQELAFISVRFVEQVFYEFKGIDKYNNAVKWLSNTLEQKGIKASDTELKALIEYAVRTMKDEFGEEWARSR